MIHLTQQKKPKKIGKLIKLKNKKICNLKFD